jgi:hypothetical protein
MFRNSDIANATKQSRFCILDCFASLAMTQEQVARGLRSSGLNAVRYLPLGHGISPRKPRNRWHSLLIAAPHSPRDLQRMYPVVFDRFAA